MTVKNCVDDGKKYFDGKKKKNVDDGEKNCFDDVLSVDAIRASVGHFACRFFFFFSVLER